MWLCTTGNIFDQFYNTQYPFTKCKQTIHDFSVVVRFFLFFFQQIVPTNTSFSNAITAHVITRRSVFHHCVLVMSIPDVNWCACIDECVHCLFIFKQLLNYKRLQNTFINFTAISRSPACLDNVLWSRCCFASTLHLYLDWLRRPWVIVA